MVENTPKVLNIFFSRANNDGILFDIYSSLCEKYNCLPNPIFILR